MTLYTIGFTKKSAQEFFELICDSGARRLLDVRLHKSSQLAGFAKENDLAYFLARLCDLNYVPEPRLAPEAAMLADYRSKRMDWNDYQRRYLALLEQRDVATMLKPDLLDGAVLLCSEDAPTRCHRRLAAEYLDKAWGGVEIVHLQ